MKRLLCILSGMDAGGAETFLMKIYRELDRSLYQMDFCINVKEKCFYEDEISSLGGRIFRIPSKSENLREFRRQLFRVVKDSGYEYVLRITSSAAGFMDLKIAKKAGAKVCCARSSNSSDGGGLKAWLAHRIGRMLYGRYVDIKLAPSDLAAEYTFGKKAYKRGKVKILKNGLDLNTFRFDEVARSAVRKEFGIPENSFVIGHVGRFSPQKNHDFLIDVFAVLKKKQDNAVLLLVGDGDLHDTVRSKVERLDINDSVVFTGIRSDVPRMLSAMDVFVLPSFYEGMPNVVIEAQAVGLPCVISDTVTREADITGAVCYLPLGNAEEWSEELFKTRPDERDTAREKLLGGDYDIQSTARQFLSVFE